MTSKPPPGRQCGSCSLCCELLAVESPLSKPAGELCQYVGKRGGCAIHDNRPYPCRRFECGWLNGRLPRRWRPDKIGAVFAGAESNRGRVGVAVYEKHQGATMGRPDVRRYLLSLAAAGHPVAVYHPGTDTVNSVSGHKFNTEQLKVATHE